MSSCCLLSSFAVKQLVSADNKQWWDRSTPSRWPWLTAHTHALTLSHLKTPWKRPSCMSPSWWQVYLAKELQISSEVQQVVVLYLEEKWLHFGLLKKERCGHPILSLKERRNCSEHGNSDSDLDHAWTDTPSYNCELQHHHTRVSLQKEVSPN